LAIQYAKAMGLKGIGIDTGASKQKLVKSLGIDAWIDVRETRDLVGAIRKVTPGGLGPHAAIVAAANQSAHTQAIEYLRPTGTLVVVGMPDA
jgi:propanol-preferring alcohol dehydrogenase